MNEKKEWKIFLWFVLIPYYVLSIIILDKIQFTGWKVVIYLFCTVIGGLALIWISAKLAALFGHKKE